MIGLRRELPAIGTYVSCCWRVLHGPLRKPAATLAFLVCANDEISAGLRTCTTTCTKPTKTSPEAKLARVPMTITTTTAVVIEG